MDYGDYRPPRKRPRHGRIDDYFDDGDGVSKFWKNEWNVILENIEIELNDVWTACTLHRHKRRHEHVCILFDGGWVEGNYENLEYTFDTNTKRLYDTDGDVIVYRHTISP